jgi:threonine/homoserine/homoserine lactone efflux protein
MPDLPTLIVFSAAALILLVTPGPAVLYIVARSIDQGRIAGIVSVLGIGIGTMVHVLAAALGISALLVSSAAAFNVVKFLGAGYLIYLGVRKLLERGLHAGPVRTETQALSRAFSQGIVVNILNPKLALFFFAFLPQFIDPAKGPAAGQSLLLGALFVTLGIASDSIYALLAGSAGAWLKQSRAFLRGQRYFAGGTYIALGVVAAASGSKQQ